MHFALSEFSGDAAAGGFDLGLGRCRAGNLDGELLGEFSVAENLDLRLLVVRKSRLGESLDRDFGTGLELLLEVGDVDGESLGVERGIVETALGPAPADGRGLCQRYRACRPGGSSPR